MSRESRSTRRTSKYEILPSTLWSMLATKKSPIGCETFRASILSVILSGSVFISRSRLVLCGEVVFLFPHLLGRRFSNQFVPRFCRNQQGDNRYYEHHCRQDDVSRLTNV